MEIFQLQFVGDKKHTGSIINQAQEGDYLHDLKARLQRTTNYYFIYSIKKDDGTILGLDCWTNKGLIDSFENFGEIIVTRSGKYSHTEVFLGNQA